MPNETIIQELKDKISSIDSDIVYILELQDVYYIKEALRKLRFFSLQEQE